MAADKYSATWVSHTSMNDFLGCPRAYYLKHVYRRPETGHKVKLMAPSLALGQAVHEVVESLSLLPVDKRFDESLVVKFDRAWDKVSGKKGGFVNPDSEQLYKNRGIAMLQRVIKNPGPLKTLAVKIKMDLPYFFLSEEENIILCGRIDWLEYLPDRDSVHIIDFKTSKKDENPDSLQLPIYHLLVDGCQKRKVDRASYWYLDRHDEPVPVTLPDLDESREKILKIAHQMKLARTLERYKCENENGCTFCKPFETIVNGNAEFVSTDPFNYDIFISDSSSIDLEDNSEIL